MHTALVIAGRDLRSRLRDRSVFVSALVAPLVLAVILTFALSGTEDFSTTYGLVVDDTGQIATSFAEVVEGPAVAEFADVISYDSRAGAEEAMADGDIAGAWIVPAGFTDAVMAGQPSSIEVVTTPGAGTSGDVAASIASGFAAEVQVRVLAVDLGADPATLDDLPTAVGLERAEAAEVTDVAASYFGPAMATFFVFFLVALGPRSLLREKRQGTLVRLLSAPVTPASVLLGKAIGVFVVAFGSLMVLWVATTLLLGTDWGAPLGVIALSAAFVLAAAAVAAFVMTLARTEKQVEGLISIVIFLFALLGGNFIQLNEMPAALRSLSQLTPNGWAMDGYVELIAGGSAGSVAVNVMVLIGIAAVFAALALPGTKRMVTP